MTPQALPVLDAVLGSTLSADEKLRLVASFDLALGLGLLDLDRRALVGAPRRRGRSTDAEVEALLDSRQQARAAKDFAAADAARDRLKAAGVEIMDGDPLRWEWRARLARLNARVWKRKGQEDREYRSAVTIRSSTSRKPGRSIRSATGASCWTGFREVGELARCC